MDDLTIKLWIFPAADFPAWCALVGNTLDEIADHRAYMAMIAALQADQERQGLKVERVGMFVAEMIHRLKERGLANTPDNRALIIAEQPSMRSDSEWRFEFHLLAPEGRTITNLEAEELLDSIINWAVDRGLSIAGGFGSPDDPSSLEPFQSDE